MARSYPNRNEAILATIKLYSKRIQKNCPNKIMRATFLDGLARALNFHRWSHLAESIRKGISPISHGAGWNDLSPESPKFLGAMRRMCETIGVSCEFGTKELAEPLGRIISYLCHAQSTAQARIQEVPLETKVHQSMAATSEEFSSDRRSETKKTVTVTIKHRKKLELG